MADNEAPEDLDEEEEEDEDDTEGSENGLKDLIDYLAKSLVENPEEVQTTEEWDGQRWVVHLDVAETDMGKVIGRGGRVAEAMRALLKVSAARSDTRAVLDIGD